MSPTLSEAERWRRRYESERRARLEAEAIAETRTREAHEVIQDLRQSQAVLDATPDFVAIADDRGKPVYLNPAARRMAGITSLADAPTLRISDLLSPSVRPRFLSDVLPAVQGGGTWSGETVLRTAAGEEVPVSQVVVAHGAAGGNEGFATIARDIRDRIELEQQLAYQAFHDPLTGLANRTLFADRVSHALDRLTRRSEAVAVLFIDVDDFKTVNDSLGHDAGDGLLVAVAERLRECLRPGDSTARLGGDEFAVLLEDLDGDGDPTAVAMDVADRVVQCLRAPLPAAHDGRGVSASVGVAIASPGEGSDVLLRNADLAMYAAKGAGKGRHQLFDPSMHHRVVERLRLKADLAGALEREEFHLVYQPIVQLDTGRVVSAEALLRWTHPERGPVPPLDYIAIAEETGQIVPLGRWVLQEACRQIRRWLDTDPTNDWLRVCVNVSARQLVDDAFVDDVAAALATAGLPPRRLVVEITESMLADGLQALAALRGLKALGVQIAIDDFGTGYSSLSYLQRFPVDILKIDRSFIARLHSDEGGDGGDGGLASGIVGLARALGTRCVAEGVETADQQDHLLGLGCELAQGWLFSRPLLGDDFGPLLKTRETLAPAPTHQHGELLASAGAA